MFLQCRKRKQHNKRWSTYRRKIQSHHLLKWELNSMWPEPNARNISDAHKDTKRESEMWNLSTPCGGNIRGFLQCPPLESSPFVYLSYNHFTFWNGSIRATFRHISPKKKTGNHYRNPLCTVYTIIFMKSLKKINCHERYLLCSKTYKAF